ncbi:MAG: hypothetical protein GVY13_15555 [Alphaproteobacteria bacterium]|nr:hypothetical protein [Alphaproteobacteria bacterium]
MTDEPRSLGAALARTLLETAPRDRDGEIITTLIGLHRALRGYIEECSLDGEAVNDVNAVLHPVEDLLGRYRPRSLAGVKALLAFCVETFDGEMDKTDEIKLWLAAATESVELLARQETIRYYDKGATRLRLSSPIPGEPVDSPRWAMSEKLTTTHSI